MATILKAGNTILRTGSNIFVTGREAVPSLRLDARLITGANGDALARWDDTSPSLFHAVQPTAALQPTLQVAGGVRSVRFRQGGTDRYMTLVATAAARTVFVVARFTPGGGGFQSVMGNASQGGTFSGNNMAFGNLYGAFRNAGNRLFVNGTLAPQDTTARSPAYVLYSLDFAVGPDAERNISLLGVTTYASPDPRYCFEGEMRFLEAYPARLTDLERRTREMQIIADFAL